MSSVHNAVSRMRATSNQELPISKSRAWREGGMRGSYPVCHKPLPRRCPASCKNQVPHYYLNARPLRPVERGSDRGGRQSGASGSRKRVRQHHFPACKWEFRTPRSGSFINGKTSLLGSRDTSSNNCDVEGKIIYKGRVQESNVRDRPIM